MNQLTDDIGVLDRHHGLVGAVAVEGLHQVALVEVGRGKHPPSWVAEVLAARDRKQAGMTAPPQGLFLVKVDY